MAAEWARLGVHSVTLHAIWSVKPWEFAPDPGAISRGLNCELSTWLEGHDHTSSGLPFKWQCTGAVPAAGSFYYTDLTHSADIMATHGVHRDSGQLGYFKYKSPITVPLAWAQVWRNCREMNRETPGIFGVTESGSVPIPLTVHYWPLIMGLTWQAIR